MPIGAGLMQGITEIHTGKEHHRAASCECWPCLVGMALPAYFTDKATKAQEDDMIYPRSQCHQNPGNLARHSQFPA